MKLISVNFCFKILSDFYKEKTEYYASNTK